MTLRPATGAAAQIDDIRWVARGIQDDTFFHALRKNQTTTSGALAEFLARVQRDRLKLSRISQKVEREGYQQEVFPFLEKTERAFIELETLLQEFRPWSDDVQSLLSLCDDQFFKLTGHKG
jgi:hypothetical protein